MTTFATKQYINIVAKDVSISGMLVKVEDPKANALFQAKTFLEMVFYPDGVTVKDEIRMTGVVVHSVSDEQNHNRKEMFGIRITDARLSRLSARLKDFKPKLPNTKILIGWRVVGCSEFRHATGL
jgi:hypothetical protein